MSAHKIYLDIRARYAYTYVKKCPYLVQVPFLLRIWASMLRALKIVGDDTVGFSVVLWVDGLNVAGLVNAVICAAVLAEPLTAFMFLIWRATIGCFYIV